MHFSKTDQRYMKMALRLAAKGCGTTSPNPMVGAVLVRSGRVLGRGFHLRAGQPHAEPHAIRDAKRRGHSCVGATLYVTLEPCSTHGRTPPCTDLIRREKIRRVVIGTLDPNPQHAGRAILLLHRAGIEVGVGCREAECREINRIFNKWILTGLPYVIAKAAVSADGFMSGQRGRWITSVSQRRAAHKLRRQVDAILVGVRTVLEDDPSLTVRHGQNVPGKVQPWRIVLDPNRRLPPGAKVLTDPWKHRTRVIRDRRLMRPDGRVDLPRLLSDLGRRGVTSVLVEGGGRVLESFFRGKLVDEFHLYRGAKKLGRDGRISAAGFLGLACQPKGRRA
ncbi:MAG: bifunctional diaminohydroxyphosphoribosylaminopyrimidine deaminase/5-amino-6-(5-phosphoribosylamino)uracil reductase RibD [Verrucomicrobiae bacterium]|nr:bifunctional diaminohydroxyphosphoribosylaminopyrimidine deaminase/5-amino-6-(5-phosphoribosylamino)uracil reductase RibD [Verrucomicrobiae bacterium]